MKRLNVKLVVILFTGVIVLTGAAFGLWMMNTSRTLEALKLSAKRLAEEGDQETAIQYYGRYLGQMPKDAEAAGQYAMLCADWSESPNAPRTANQFAFQQLERALRLDSSRDDIRRRLLKYTMARRRIADAIQHIDVLLTKYPEDGELYARLAQCHVAQNRMDQAREAFEKSIELDPTRVKTYLLYAVLLRSKMERVEDANVLIDKMVETNPENYRSYLVRCSYLQSYGLVEEAWQDILQAVERAPEEMEVLLTAASLARRTKRVDEAREFLAKALEVDSSNQAVYRMLAIMAHESGDSELTMKYVQEGLGKVPNSTVLLEMKASLLIQEEKLDEAQEVITELDNLRYDIEKLDYLRAQVLLRERKYVRATQLLESIRPLLVRDRFNRIRTNLSLITCYQNLGQNDLVLDASNRVLADDPENTIALRRRMAVRMRNDQYDKVLGDAEGRKSMAPIAFHSMLRKQLALPEEQRDWTQVEQYIAEIRKSIDQIEDEVVRNRQNIHLKLFEAEILFNKGLTEESERLINEAHDARPDDVSMWVALANFKHRTEGLDAMFAVLDKAESQLGTQLLLDRKRIEGLQSMRSEEAVDKLVTMEPVIKDKYSDEEQAVLLSDLSEALFSLGSYENAKRIFRFVDEHAPFEDLRIRMRRFAMASAVADDEGMQEAIERIAEVVGKESAEWNYAQAMRRVTLTEKGKMDSQELLKAREHIEKAAETRPNWHAVWRVRALIDRQEGNYNSAIDNYERAIELGERQRGYFMDLVRLYSITRQPEKALKYLEQLRQSSPDSPQMARGEMLIRMQSGDAKGALEAAKQVIENSENAGDWVQYGQILAKLEREDDSFENDVTAEAAFRKATELSPTDGSIWSTLVQYLVGVNRKEEAEKVIAEMQGHLPDDQEPLVMGMCYQMVGRGEDAEKSFLRAVEQRPDDLGVLRTMVSFYMQNRDLPNASGYLDKMLALAEKGGEDQSQTNIRWARRAKGQLIASSGNYEDLQAALAIIGKNAVDSVLPRVETVLEATLLGGRADFESRSEAIRLLEDIQTRLRDQGAELSPGEKHLLARLYERDYKPDSWLKCREQMLDLLAANPENKSFKYDFIRMMTDRAEGQEDLAEVKNWLDSLERQGEGDLLTESRVRYLAKAGRTDEAVKTMKKAVPVVADILPEEVQRLFSAARIMEELKLYDAAEEFLKRYANAKPEEQLRLAAFYGRRFRIDDALFICEKALSGHSYTEVSAIAQGVLRNCVAKVEIDDKHFSRVEEWINKALEEKINPQAVKVTLADFRDAQGRYDDAVKIYEALLKNKDINDRERVTALNNLAFIYAVRDGNGKRAKPLIDNAIDILGPLSELLDTKAMVLLAMGDTEQSISLLDSALRTSPEDSMLYFHKAKAQKSANEMDGFFESMERAVAKGLDETKLPALEHKSYRDLLKTFKLIRAG